MDTTLILKYLTDLKENNNREWYHAHKAENREATAQFEALVQALIFGIGEFDSSVVHNQAKELTFKLVRDTRFSHDKSPYRAAFRAHIAAKGKLPIPVGYYLMVEPGGRSFLGGGLFADMFSDATRMVRDYLTEHGEEFAQVIHAPAFERYFSVCGTSLKKVPSGYDKEHPQAEYLKYKSWYVEYPIEDHVIMDADGFVEEAKKLFGLMKPFNDYLNRALAGFQMPSRE